MKHFGVSKPASNREKAVRFTPFVSTGSRLLKIQRRWLLILALIFASSIPANVGALTINATFDSTITSDPQAATIEATINSAILVYEADFSDPITVDITFMEASTGLGGSSTFRQSFSYSSYTAALISHATTADDATMLVHLPGGSSNPVNGNVNIALSRALARALGLDSSPPSGPDSTISLNTAIMNLSPSQTVSTNYSLFTVVSHEIDEALGFGSALNGLTNGQAIPTGAVLPEDLFRFDANGVRSFTTDPNAASYFSLDGSSDIARFNQYDGGLDSNGKPKHADFGDWYSPGTQTPQVQDAFGTAGAAPVLGVELRVLDVLGYTRLPTPVWVDFNFTGTPAGTFVAPDKTLASGVAAVNPGGTIIIKAGNSGETATINKAMTLTSFGGNAIIGLANPVAAPEAVLNTPSAPTSPEVNSEPIGAIQIYSGTMNLSSPAN